MEGDFARNDMTPADLAALSNAVTALERTSFAVRVTRLLGRQLQAAGQFLPVQASAFISKVSTAALKQAMHVALASLRDSGPKDRRSFHRTLAAASGAAGGAFGLAALPVELPVSTTVMLRSIAAIAQSEGEDMSNPETALACLQVFALGGPAENVDVTEGGYFALRGLFAKSISEAASYIAQKGIVDEAAPVLMRFMAQIASRFGVVVSQKVAAQTIPLVGAVGGAALNVAFIDHYQSLAKGHFTVRRLERKYSTPTVQRAYERIAAEQGFSMRGKPKSA